MCNNQEKKIYCFLKVHVKGSCDRARETSHGSIFHYLFMTLLSTHFQQIVLINTVKGLDKM